MFDYLSGVVKGELSTADFPATVGSVDSKYDGEKDFGQSTSTGVKSDEEAGLPVSTLIMVVGAVGVLGALAMLYMYNKSRDDGSVRGDQDWGNQDAQWELEENGKDKKEYKKQDEGYGAYAENYPVAEAVAQPTM